jgi:hypothetical protein
VTRTDYIRLDSVTLEIPTEGAQRLWVLERAPNVADSARADAFRFVNAIAILGEAAVLIGFVRSLEARESTEECLASPRVRLHMARNATSFATLDLAIAWAECRRMAWVGQGWTEWQPDPRDR